MARQNRQAGTAPTGGDSSQKRDHIVETSVHEKKGISDDASNGGPSLEVWEEASVSGSISLSLKSDACRKDDGGHILCSVDGCSHRMEDQPLYYQRYKVCKDHLRKWSLLVQGVAQRFCQQCGRFHNIEEFDAKKRNCKARLEKHNSRRRKYVVTKDGSKIRKQGDYEGQNMLHYQSTTPLPVIDDTFAIDIPIIDNGSDQRHQLGELNGPENGKELYTNDGTISAHPGLVAKKIAEYYQTPNRKECFYPPFVKHIILVERYLGQRILQNWMGKSSPEDAEVALDEELRQAESMVSAIHQVLSQERTGPMQKDLLKDMGLI